MNELPALLLSGAMGLLLGAVFFGGLWWTVRRGVSSKRPVLWFLGSLLLRMGLVLTGLYFVADGHWERLVAALLGLVAARLIVNHRLRSEPARRPGRPEASGSSPAEDNGRAS